MMNVLFSGRISYSWRLIIWECLVLELAPRFVLVKLNQKSPTKRLPCLQMCGSCPSHGHHLASDTRDVVFALPWLAHLPVTFWRG